MLQKCERGAQQERAAVHGGGVGWGVQPGAAFEILINHFTGTRKPISL